MDEESALRTLAQTASSISTSEPSERKRRLLNLGCSNRTWANGDLRAEYKQSFDFLVKTFANRPLIRKQERCQREIYRHQYAEPSYLSEEVALLDLARDA